MSPLSDDGVKCCRLPPTPELDRLRVVLVSLRNPLNIGAAARAMSNFGCLHLRLVNPYKVAFREARSAVGAASLLAAAREYETVADAVSDCSLVVGTTAIRHRELHHPLRPLAQGAKLIRKHFASAPVALLFGSEKYGLSNEDMSHCHWLINIPTREDHISMNLGQAVAVCLYELSRNASPDAESKFAPIVPPVDLERITTAWFEALRISGYVKPKLEDSTRMKLRRMIRRMDMQGDDAETWLGMFRKILWKLNVERKP